jgi:hypothetical protein
MTTITIIAIITRVIVTTITIGIAQMATKIRIVTK